MKSRNLKTNIILSFFAVISILVVSVAILGYYIINRNVIQRAQRQIKNDLKVARWAYNTEIDRIRLAFNLVGPSNDLERLKGQIGLDYISVVDKNDLPAIKSEVVRAAFEGKALAATRIIGPEELKEMGRSLYEKSVIEIKPTAKARPTEIHILDSAMAVGYAKPLFDNAGHVRAVMYGGKIINRDAELVDKIRSFVFENQMYEGRPTGTVTIFLDDVRIATNVLDKNGERAIGTRVSATVYKKVVEEGRTFLDRAFVVTDWYLTAYEPIRNIEGKVIGILYVGILEKPFVDMRRNVFLVFFGIVVLASLLAVILGLVLAQGMARPLTRLLEAAGRFSKGDLSHRIGMFNSRVREIDVLAEAFNDMAAKIDEREKRLEALNKELEALNKSYLDLVGFVSHELKGILSSTIMNAYTVRDGFLGMVNFKQRKALDSIARNLDYLEATVKNFLNLSRLEKGELAVSKSEVLLKENIVDPSLEAFGRQATDKEMQVVNDTAAGLKVMADVDLLQIVVNNLIGNAVKYGQRGGILRVSAEIRNGTAHVEVYNDGKPLAQDEIDKLFRRFSRLKSEETRNVQGTGLGLFVSKEIIEKHGGWIWVEARPKGNAFVFEIK
ncbi:signal transduction histidine kinase [Candidatus Velamenicoccus archaeovorus]|uniref:histidine kinase n=1 Tax=Velamenicoccus archaeovorus TaxID=1930593 RepID=A0A410P3D3_VELA1|nr:cache domain-containing protein [Candidatus Velamenicoccus archaeovorus]QAT16588.1 signal transduction histidine kinase [Candidatus Velamenicoccus archaeovorus]